MLFVLSISIYWSISPRNSPNPKSSTWVYFQFSKWSNLTPMHKFLLQLFGCFFMKVLIHIHLHKQYPAFSLMWYSQPSMAILITNLSMLIPFLFPSLCKARVIINSLKFQMLFFPWRKTFVVDRTAISSFQFFWLIRCLRIHFFNTKMRLKTSGRDL